MVEVRPCYSEEEGEYLEDRDEEGNLCLEVEEGVDHYCMSSSVVVEGLAKGY